MSGMLYYYSLKPPKPLTWNQVKNLVWLHTIKKSQVYNLKLFSSEKATLSKKIIIKLCLTQPFSKCCREHCRVSFQLSGYISVLFVWCPVKPQTLLRAPMNLGTQNLHWAPCLSPVPPHQGEPELYLCHSSQAEAHPPQGWEVPVLDKRAGRVQPRLSGSFAPSMGMRRQLNNHISCEDRNWWALLLLHKASTSSSRGLTAYKASTLAWNSPWQESKVWNRKYNYFTSPLCSCNSTAA